MQKFVECNEIIKIPYIFATLHFSLRPDHQLDLLHHFFIKAISKNASVSDIATAINLPEKVVLEELRQMCNQGYINSGYELTDYAREYLSLVGSIDQIQKQCTSLYINLLSGKFSKEISSEAISETMEVRPKISQTMIENLSFADIKDFLSVNLNCLRGKTQEFIDRLSDCISLEFDFKNQNNFNLNDCDFEYVHAKKIPCYSGSFYDDRNYNVTAKGTFYHYEYKCMIDKKIEFAYFEALKKQKNKIQISHEEKKLISEFDTIQKNKNKIFQCWVDAVSGNIFFDMPSMEVRNANFVLKDYIKRSDELDEKVMSELIRKNSISSNCKLKIMHFERVPYFVGFDIEEILSKGERVCSN